MGAEKLGQSRVRRGVKKGNSRLGGRPQVDDVSNDVQVEKDWVEVKSANELVSERTEGLQAMNHSQLAAALWMMLSFGEGGRVLGVPDVTP